MIDAKERRIGQMLPLRASSKPGRAPHVSSYFPELKAASRSPPHLSGVRPTNPAFYTGDQVFGPLIRLCTDQSIATGHLAACTVHWPITRCKGALALTGRHSAAFFAALRKNLCKPFQQQLPADLASGQNPQLFYQFGTPAPQNFW